MIKTNAAAYIRVSTSSKAQTHSYKYQESYWTEMLQGMSDINLIGVYADLGISGRFMKKRPQFMAMVDDCRRGLIKKIFVKSVSRFSRNTVELLEMVKELRELNVSVFFEQENIDTLRTTSDLELSIAAAVAEADLQRYSENQRWSIAHKYANGIIAVGNKIYGYQMTKDNDLIPIPEESNVVKQIFDWYLEGWSMEKIARKLNESGIKTVRDSTKWHGTTIGNMLKNERYKGDSVQHKFVTYNGVKRKNEGGILKKQLYIEDSHSAIIDKEVFDKTQQELKKRTNLKLAGNSNKLHEFTSLIECGICGKKFIHKINNAGTLWETEFWNCSKKLKEGKSNCCSNGIKDKVVRDKFVEVFNEFIQDGFDNSIVLKAKGERECLLQEEYELRKLNANGYIVKIHYEKTNEELQAKIKEQEKIMQKFKMKNVTSKDCSPIKGYDSIKFNKFIAEILIRDWTITFKFINGVEITKAYTNGEHGNIRDWVVKQKRQRR